MKFLVDECLSPKLVKLAQEKGYGESTHVVWRKLAGKKDWELKPLVLDGEILLTFGGLFPVQDRAGSTLMLLHAGLVCLNGPEGMKVDLQLELFGHALEELAVDGDLINQVIEVTLEDNDELRILRYSLRRAVENGRPQP